MTQPLPNTGNFFILDLDAKVSVGWLFLGGRPIEQFAGRIDGTLTKPRAEVEHPYTTWPNGRQVLSRSFIQLLSERGVDYFFVEPAHIKPKVLSTSQPFTAEEVAGFYAACHEFGIVPLGPHFAWARYALAATKTRKETVNDGRRWYQRNTDAALLGAALAAREHFGNVLRLRPMSDEQTNAFAERDIRRIEVRRPTQELINELRFDAVQIPVEMLLTPHVPEKVTQTMAAIVWQHPEWTWGKVKRTYEFHGRAASGRGKASLARAQVAHQQGKPSFVRNYGWAAVQWEFERVSSIFRGVKFEQPFPAPLSSDEGALFEIDRSQLSLFDAGLRIPSSDGSSLPAEQGAEPLGGGPANTGVSRLGSIRPEELLEHSGSELVNTAVARLASTRPECVEVGAE